MESEKKIRNYLKKRIKEEGYPLEIEISNNLDKRKQWGVDNSVYFFDSELNMGRTIDIQASHWHLELTEEMEPFFAVCNLLVECKKSASHAWIFFTRPHTTFPHYFGQVLDFVQVKTGMKSACFVNLLRRKGKPSLHYANYKRVAFSYTELRFDKSKSKSKSSANLILKAKNQLMKFISYHNQRIKKTNLKDWSAMPFYFYFPVVVLDGRMYEYFEKSEKRYLVPIKRVLLESSHYPAYHYRDVKFAIEIVTKDVFEEILNDVEKDCSTIYSEIIRAREMLIAKYSQFLPQGALKKALLEHKKRKTTTKN